MNISIAHNACVKYLSNFVIRSQMLINFSFLILHIRCTIRAETYYYVPCWKNSMQTLFIYSKMSTDAADSAEPKSQNFSVMLPFCALLIHRDSYSSPIKSNVPSHVKPIYFDLSMNSTVSFLETVAMVFFFKTQQLSYWGSCHQYHGLSSCPIYILRCMFENLNGVSLRHGHF